MRFIKYILISSLVLLNIKCCRTSCVKIFQNPYAASTQIMIGKVEGIIEGSIKCYCKNGKFPASNEEIRGFTKKNVNPKDLRKLEFSTQGERRLTVNFDFAEFVRDNYRVLKYRGFCGIFIPDDKKCMEENDVQIYITDFIIYAEGKEKSGKPLDIDTPIIIKFENFQSRTISTIQHGYEI